MWQEPVFDRTSDDTLVARAGQSTIDENKGALNYQDLNRIEDNYKYLLEHLASNAMFIPHMYRNVQETNFETIQVESGGLDDTTLFLLHGESLEDNSNYGVSITNNGVTTSDAKSKFGGKSLYFDGSSYLEAALAVEGDVTIDCWVYFTEYGSSYPTPFQLVSGSHRGIYVHIMSSTTRMGASTSENDNQSTDSSDSLSLNTWHHIAIVRSGTNVYLFINGTKKGTMANSLTTNDKIVLGHLSSAASGTKYKGYMDELRVSNTARWTTDFTPPTKPYGEITIHTETKPIKKTYTDWQEQNIPWLSEIDRIRQNFNNLIALFLRTLDLPTFPSSSYLMYTEVNDWERVSLIGKTMFENMEKEYVYSGTIDSGGERLL